MTPAIDLTRWNRSGLSRFPYTKGGAAEWLELIRLHLLLMSAMPDRVPPDITLNADEWIEALARTEEIDGLAVGEALEAIGARWRILEAPETEEGYRRANPAPTYRDAVAARYAHVSADQSAQIARAFARAVHVLTRSIDAYAQEGLLGTVTQPDHLRLLIEMTGLTPTPAASATMPVALILKPGTAAQTIAAGLVVEPRVKGEDAPLTFESLDPVFAAPTLNTIEPADRFLPTILPFFLPSLRVIRTAQPVTGNIGDGSGLARSGGGAGAATPGSATFVRVLTRDARTLLVQTAPDIEARMPDRLELRPGLRLVPRRTDPRWLPLKEDHGLTVGTAVIARVGGANVALRVSEIDGRDIRLADGDGVFEDADRNATTRVTRAIRGSMIPQYDADDETYSVVTSFSLSVSPGQLAQAVAAPEASSIDVDRAVLAEPNRVTIPIGAIPQGLEADTFAIAELRPSGTAVVRITAVVLSGGQVFVDVEGAEAAQVRALRAAFEVSAAIAFETPSSESLVSAERITTALSAVPEQAAGRARLMLAVTPTQAVAFEAVLEADGDIVPVQPMPEGLAGLTRGTSAIHGNVVTFGHGKSQPATPLGSGDGTEAGQTFTFAKGTLATRMAPDEDGGVAPDVAISVAGRSYRRVTSLAGLDPEDDAVYFADVTFEGHTRFHFPFRLPSGPANVMLARVRVGAGANGNKVVPFAVAKLSKADARVDSLVQPVAAQFGRDMPTVDAIRAGSKRGLAELAHLVTAQDYAAHAERHTGVWHARADASVRASDGGRVTMRVVVVPAGGGPITQLREPLKAHLLRKAAPGVSVTVDPFVPVPLVVEATVRLIAGYGASPELQVELSALLLEQYGLRQRPLGAELFVSVLVAALERHPAVKRVALAVSLAGDAAPLSERRNGDGVLQALILRPDQAAFLDPERLTLTLETAGA